MDAVQKIIQQEIQVIRKSLDEEDLKTIFIVSDRIMADLLFVDKKDFMAIAWIIKDWAGSLYTLNKKKDKSKFQFALDHIKIGVDSIHKLLNIEPLNASSFIEIYLETQDELIEAFMNNSEKGVYTRQTEFTKQGTLAMLNVLYQNKDSLLNKNNESIQGIGLELTRLSRTYGGKEANLVALILRSLYDYQQNIMYEIKSRDNLSQETIAACTTQMNEYVDLIHGLMREINNNNMNDLYACSISLLGALGVDERMYYYKYMTDPFINTEPIKEKVELPDDTKKKINDLIAKSIDDEIK